MGSVTGRFAPSPTGALHAGSLVAALASWLDARAHGGRWLVRIEDDDTPRCVPGADRVILSQLAACALLPDAPPVRQSQRSALYGAALQRLLNDGAAYACGCTRRDIEAALAARGTPRPRHGELVYPGTCRGGLQGKAARATRLRCDTGRDSLDDHGSDSGDDSGDLVVDWFDRRLGLQRQNVSRAVGDFVLQRADGVWAYQLAVVVDDAAQGISHVVRGEDLADNTARQIHLQRRLGLPTPAYLHTPLVPGADGEKLSKQNGARALDLRDPLAALRAAGAVLDVRPHSDHVADWLAQATALWAARWRQAGA